MNPNKEHIDSVKMMRDIRERLSEKYFGHPEVLKKDMKAIEEKYNLRDRVKNSSTAKKRKAA